MAVARTPAVLPLDGAEYALVALNFTDAEQTTEFWFPAAGDYDERIDGAAALNGVVAYQPVSFTVPSNHGRAWVQR